MIPKAILPIFLLVLLSVSVIAQTAPSGDTAIINQLIERLERNKAEIIKSVRDAQTLSQNQTNATIDQNFAVLDGRIQDFLKASKRDIAVIMVATFVLGFCLSQVIRLAVERKRRKGLIKQGLDLEVAVERLNKEAGELTTKIRQLKILDDKYSQELKSLSKKHPFITIQGFLLAIIALCIGIVGTLLATGAIKLG